jgi:hypothetical protein
VNRLSRSTRTSYQKAVSFTSVLPIEAMIVANEFCDAVSLQMQAANNCLSDTHISCPGSPLMCRFPERIVPDNHLQNLYIIAVTCPLFVPLPAPYCQTPSLPSILSCPVTARSLRPSWAYRRRSRVRLTSQQPPFVDSDIDTIKCEFQILPWDVYLAFRLTLCKLSPASCQVWVGILKGR